MDYLELDKLKKHLNVDWDFTDDDEYIESLGDVAEAMLAKDLDISLEELISAEGDMPKPVLHAMMLIVGNLYANRESIAFASAVEVPQTYKFLIDYYRNYRQ